jgi:hypothetical protein
MIRPPQEWTLQQEWALALRTIDRRYRSRDQVSVGGDGRPHRVEQQRAFRPARRGRLERILDRPRAALRPMARHPFRARGRRHLLPPTFSRSRCPSTPVRLCPGVFAPEDRARLPAPSVVVEHRERSSGIRGLPHTSDVLASWSHGLGINTYMAQFGGEKQHLTRRNAADWEHQMLLPPSGPTNCPSKQL